MKFELTPEHVTIIGEALSQGPYRTVAPVIAELQRQIDQQQSPPPQRPFTD